MKKLLNWMMMNYVIMKYVNIVNYLTVSISYVGIYRVLYITNIRNYIVI